MRARQIILSLLVLVVALGPAWSDVRLPHVFGSHMVLQRDMAMPVWGWAEPGEQVTVRLSDKAPVTTQAGAEGKWQVTLPAAQAGGPFQLKVTGRNEIVLDDVVVGEVWVCSGQSNMEMTVQSSNNAADEIAAANFPLIRQIKVPRVTAGFPSEDFTGDWQVCSPTTVAPFTAAGYFMARELYRELGVAVGLINTSWGGTRIEPWTPPVGFAQVPALKSIYDQVTLTDPRSEAYKKMLGEYVTGLDKWMAQARTSLAESKPLDPAPAYPDGLKPLTGNGQPTALYNAMVSPLIPFAIRGAIWYQGEANHGEGMLYTEKMKALIGGWRALWKQGDFPFYYVQIAPYNYGNEDPNILPTFWEAQGAAEAIPNTGMVVTNDIADLTNIHPKDKQTVGKRLAALALKGAYGRNEVVAKGPTYKSMKIEGDKIRISFDNVGSGLVSRDGKPLDWFEIIGTDTDFVPAQAVIEGDTVVLSSPEVKEPVAMRFAWHRDANQNLMNREGFPALTFRAGEVPQIDWMALKVKEAKQYQLVYELDLKKAARDIKYDIDNHAGVGPFDRIAYYLELQQFGKPSTYVWVSMDAFTKDVTKIGIPTIASKAVFQQKVSNMNVVSNVRSVVTGEGITTGNIEFWPNNYGATNAVNVASASAQVWDFGDQYSAPEDGYGSMQVHNYGAKQTIFAFNNWKAGGRADLGIGNSTGANPDWTFAANADQYSVRKLRVLVKPAG
ncbi:MAG: sialate O-acetylesterase [Armatimonadia bacterium]